jgi:hypothetical protein
MALLGGPKVIARVNSSSVSALAVMSFEWIMRVDGQVCYRLTKVDGRSERNPWTVVTQLRSAELHGLHRDRGKAKALLDDLARQHGHKIG